MLEMMLHGNPRAIDEVQADLATPEGAVAAARLVAQLTTTQPSVNVEDAIWNRILQLNDRANKQRKMFGVGDLDEFCLLHEPIVRQIGNTLLNSGSDKKAVPPQIFEYILGNGQNLLLLLQTKQTQDPSSLAFYGYIKVLLSTPSYEFPHAILTLILDYQDPNLRYQQLCHEFHRTTLLAYPQLQPNSVSTQIAKTKKNKAPKRFVAMQPFTKDFGLIQAGGGGDVVANLQGLSNLLAGFYLAQGRTEKAKNYAITALSYQTELASNIHLRKAALQHSLVAYICLARCALLENQLNLIDEYADQAINIAAQLVIFAGDTNEALKQLENVYQRLIGIYLKTENYSQVLYYFEKLIALVEQRRGLIQKLWLPYLKQQLDLKVITLTEEDKATGQRMKAETQGYVVIANAEVQACKKFLDAKPKQVAFYENKYFEQLQKQFSNSSASACYELTKEGANLVFKIKEGAPQQNPLKQAIALQREVDIYYDKKQKSFSIAISSLTPQRASWLFAKLSAFQVKVQAASAPVASAALPATPVDTSVESMNPATVSDADDREIKHSDTVPRASKSQLKQQKKLAGAAAAHGLFPAAPPPTAATLTPAQRLKEAGLFPLSNKFIPEGIYYAKIDPVILDALGADEHAVLVSKLELGRLLTTPQDGDGVKHCVEDYGNPSLEKFDYKVRMTHGVLGDTRIYGEVMKPDAAALQAIGETRFHPVIICFNLAVTNAHQALARPGFTAAAV